MKDLCLGIRSTKNTDVGKKLTVSDSLKKDKVVELAESFGPWMFVERKSRRNSMARQSLVTRVTENGALNLIGIKMIENGVVAMNLLGMRLQKWRFLKAEGIEAFGNFENFISIGLDQSAPRAGGLELSIILGNFMVMQGDNMELVSHSGVSATKEGPISMLGLIELLIRLREVKGSRFQNGRGQGLKVVLSKVVVLSVRSF
ncbi:hypothetical protein PVK06_049032 [Gossypium arboreum]|uniref:Uncharacterized protein n=1 Tax=Gossypium arboreum TaxID=29729 RepID=A0ABR0MHK9_GOSAR|nr:hypothetical protein PVK06_049032 [Gossypium arboreum]